MATYNKEDVQNFENTIKIRKADRPIEEYEITNFKDYDSFNVNSFKGKFARAG